MPSASRLTPSRWLERCSCPRPSRRDPRPSASRARPSPLLVEQQRPVVRQPHKNRPLRWNMKSLWQTQIQSFQHLFWLLRFILNFHILGWCVKRECKVAFSHSGSFSLSRSPLALSPLSLSSLSLPLFLSIYLSLSLSLSPLPFQDKTHARLNVSLGEQWKGGRD